MKTQLSTSGTRPKVRLLPDAATENMAGLKRVKFLDGREQEQEYSANMVESLADEYKQRKASLDGNLQRVIAGHRVAHMEVSRKTPAEREAEEKQREEAEAERAKNPLARLMDAQPTREEAPSDLLADGFVRSKRAQQLRVKDSLNGQLNEIGEQKTALIQKLNKALLKLDKINQEKKQLSLDLLEMVKFVRDLQKAASGGDDIEGIVSAQMKRDFHREKEMN